MYVFKIIHVPRAEMCHDMCSKNCAVISYSDKQRVVFQHFSAFQGIQKKKKVLYGIFIRLIEQHNCADMNLFIIYAKFSKV
jgi:hypothetical protein